MMSFFNFFHNHIVQKYQNEISPILYYGISTKTNEKDLKIPNLQPTDWKHPYWMSLYIGMVVILNSVLHSSHLRLPGTAATAAAGDWQEKKKM